MTCHKSTERAILGMRWTACSGNADVACNGCPRLLNVAGVLMMSTLVSCVQRFSIHDLLLVVVFLFTETVSFHSTVCVDPFATRNSPCWCRHSTGVKLFSQVRLVYLIFAAPPRDTARGATFFFFEEGAVACLSKHRQQHGWTCPLPHGNAVFCSSEQSDIGSHLVIET